MDFRTVNEYDLALYRRVCMWVQVVQSVITVFLLMNTLVRPVHMTLAVLLVLVLALTHFKWESRLCRVVVRVITAIPLLLVAVFAADFVLCLVAKTPLISWLETVGIIGSAFFAYFAPAAAFVSLKEGRYDRVIGCIVATCLPLMAAVATLNEQVCNTVLWSWDHQVVRYVWLGAAVFGAIWVWLCAFIRTPEQQAAEKAAKEEKAAKRARKRAKTGE